MKFSIHDRGIDIEVEYDQLLVIVGESSPRKKVIERVIYLLGLTLIGDIGGLERDFHPGREQRETLIGSVRGLERDFHPGREQREAVARVREVLAQSPDIGIVWYTNSPYLVDFLDYSEVLCVAEALDGRIVGDRLDKHPGLPRFKAGMLPGKFWSSVGEEWVLSQGGDKK